MSLAGVARFHWIEVAEYCVFLLQFHCVLEGEFLLKLFSSLTCSFLSSEFCEAHLQLLFTILEKAPQATIRANTIVAVGDLTFRFPNLIEPWTSHLYARFVNGELQTYKVLESVLSVSEESNRSLLLVKWTIHFPPSQPFLPVLTTSLSLHKYLPHQGHNRSFYIVPKNVVMVQLNLDKS